MVSTKLMFNYDITDEELLPLIHMQKIAHEDSVLRYFELHTLLTENIMRTQRDQEAIVLASAAGIVSEKTRTSEKIVDADSETRSSYAITYYNPELQETEVLETNADIKIHDYATRMIEESTSAQSVYPIYSYIAAPILREEIIPWRLKMILEEREYGTPPPSASGVVLVPLPLEPKQKSKVASALKRKEEIKEALAKVVMRKEETERKLILEIILFENVINDLKEGEVIAEILNKLPPLSKARYLAVLKKKKLTREELIHMLVHDLAFLKNLEDKLKLSTVDDLLNIFKILQNIKKKEE